MNNVESREEHQDAVAYLVLKLLMQGHMHLTRFRIALAEHLGGIKTNRKDVPKDDDIVRMCSGLVVIDPAEHTTRLVHISLQQYLKGRKVR